MRRTVRFYDIRSPFPPKSNLSREASRIGKVGLHFSFFISALIRSETRRLFSFVLHHGITNMAKQFASVAFAFFDMLYRNDGLIDLILLGNPKSHQNSLMIQRRD